MLNTMQLNELFSKQIKKIAICLSAMLVITAVTIVLIFTTPLVKVYAIPYAHIIIPIVQIGLVMVLSFNSGIYTMNKSTLYAISFMFAFLTGLSLAPYVYYHIDAVLITLIVTIVLFFALGIYGYTTSKPLYKLSTIITIGLISLIAVSLFNLFLQNPMIEYILSIFGVLIFLAYIAYDVNKIKMQTLYLLSNQNELIQTKVMDNIAIISALSLYLDIINLFIYLLNLFGRKK